MSAASRRSLSHSRRVGGSARSEDRDPACGSSRPAPSATSNVRPPTPTPVPSSRWPPAPAGLHRRQRRLPPVQTSRAGRILFLLDRANLARGFRSKSSRGDGRRSSEERFESVAVEIIHGRGKDGRFVEYVLAASLLEQSDEFRGPEVPFRGPEWRSGSDYPRWLHESETCHSPASGRQAPRRPVIPAKAGIHFNHESLWIPAFAGMTG